MTLPTQSEMFGNALDALDAARKSLSDARDSLNGDWRPVGSELTNAGADARQHGLRHIGTLKNEIDEIKQLMREAIEAERRRR